MITSSDIEDVQGVSGLQQSMLYTSLSDPSGGHYIEQFSLTFHSFNPSYMQEALDELITRHWALRSIFVWREQDKARIVTLETLESPLSSVNYSTFDELLAVDRARGFSLNQDSPIRFTYAIATDNSARCILTFHHAAVDGWSIAILTNELLGLYGSLLNKLPLPPSTEDPKPSLNDNNPDASFWSSYSDSVTTTANLSTLIQPHTNIKAYADFGLQLSSAQTERVNNWCKEQRITLSSLVHSAWGLTLSYLSGLQTVVYGSIDSGRRHLTDGENAVGMFMSLMPVKLKANEDILVAQLVQEFQKDYWSALQNPPPDPAELVERLDRHASGSLFDSVLIIQNYPQPNGWENIQLESLSGHEQADVPLVLAVGSGDLLTTLFRYQAHSLDESAVASIGGLLSGILVSMCENGTNKVSDVFDSCSNSIKVVGNSDNEYSSHVDQWPRCIDKFIESVGRDPEAIAFLASVTGEDPSASDTTFHQLSCRAQAIREVLSLRTVSSGEIVGLRLPRGVDATATMLAILAQDAIYLPLDPEYPEARLQQMIEQAKPKLIIDAQILAEISAAGSTTQSAPLDVVNGRQCPNMCLLYTSGSTGTPKGVMLTHAAVCNRLAWQAERYPNTTSDIYCVRTPLTFVDSVSETFLPLCTGAKMLIISDVTLHSLQKLCAELVSSSVSRILLVPSLLAALLDELQQTGRTLPDLRQCVVSGEALTSALAQQFSDALPNATLLNFYGSTEVAADALYHEVAGKNLASEHQPTLVPIGKPIHNLSARVINASGRSLPPMCIGQLAVSGVGVAAGYYASDRQAQTSFDGGEYRTGDLAHVDQDGIVHFHGRSDRQIQIAGRRVEPAEVEQAICKLEEIHDAAVWLQGEILVAVYCANVDAPDSFLHEKLLEHLHASLPLHFVPARMLLASQMPLLPNGKLDQIALSQLVDWNEAPVTELGRLDPLSGPHQQILGAVVANVWKELLCLTTVDLQANFFYLGGNSLLAMRMLAKLERSLNREIPLSVLIDNPTVNSLARALCDEGFKNTNTNVITLREGDASAHGSIVCIHGDAYNLPGLVHCERPMYWLSQWQLRMELTRKSRVLIDEPIEDIAIRYATDLDRVELGSHTTILAACGAAVLAIEVARILLQKGLVVRLVLMDLPGGKLARLAGVSRKLPLSDPSIDTVSEPLPASSTKLSGLPRFLLRAQRFVMWNVRRTPWYRSYLLSKFEKMATNGVEFSDSDALRYCNFRLNKSLAEYHIQQLDCPIQLVWSRQWSSGATQVDEVRLPILWEEAFPQLTSMHLSPARVHNDLLQNKGAEFVAQLLST